MGRYNLLLINGAILTACAVFIYPGRSTVLTALLLLLPFLDRTWETPAWPSQKSNFSITVVLFASYSLLIALNPEKLYLALSLLFLIALPEEWFFRAYLMVRIQSFFKNWRGNSTIALWGANITSSALFALMHTPTQGLFGLTVFFPSLVFAWVYQKCRNMLIVVLLHAISNLVFLLYMKEWLVI